MKRAVALSVAMLAGSAMAAEKKTYNYTCKGGGFSVTAVVENSGGVDRWSKSDPVILRIGAEPPQTLIADPDAPDADSYKNKDYEFYALKTFITLTHKSHGTVVKFYNACRVE
jgi:hypothetical protein